MNYRFALEDKKVKMKELELEIVRRELDKKKNNKTEMQNYMKYTE